MPTWDSNGIFVSGSSDGVYLTPNIGVPVTIQGEYLASGSLGADWPAKLDLPKPDPDLAEAVREFYKSILDQPLTVEMIQKWDRLCELIAAVQEMAEKYISLIEDEITSKIEG